MRRIASELTILAVLSLSACTSPTSYTVQAHAVGISLSAFSRTPPTIDGAIGKAEWSSASKATISANTTRDVPLIGDIYEMNDGANMYLAMRISRGGVAIPQSSLIVDVTFDNTHSGIYHSNMDRIEYCGSGQCAGALPLTNAIDYNLISMNGACCWAFPDISLGGTNDLVASASSDSTYNYVELQHPLCSLDSNDFCLKVGDTVGFQFYILYDRVDTAQWPGVPPIEWGDITIVGLTSNVPLPGPVKNGSSNDHNHSFPAMGISTRHILDNAGVGFLRAVVSQNQMEGTPLAANKDESTVSASRGGDFNSSGQPTIYYLVIGGMFAVLAVSLILAETRSPRSKGRTS